MSDHHSASLGESNENHAGLSRRRILQSTAAMALAGSMGLGASACSNTRSTRVDKAVRHGRIRQSIVYWCFSDHWSVEQSCRIAKTMGVNSIELVSVADYPTLKKHGLTNAIAQIDMGEDPPFVYGFNNTAYHERVIGATRKAIDAAKEYGYKRVICFTGYKYKDPMNPASGVISDEQGMKNCVAGLKKVVGYAERHGITLCLEQLNTRDDTHPMKGHPGYHGDDIDWCADICKAVGSPSMKLLFDIYHVQIMNGDVIRRIDQYKDLLGHIHVAGNPGRAEPDQTQEINYAACMDALLAVGYKGYVGQEFIPIRHPRRSLHEAVALCDR